MGSGKAQNGKESKRLKERIPLATGRGFRDRHGALLLVSCTVFSPSCSVISLRNFARCILMSVQTSFRLSDMSFQVTR